MKRYPVFWRRSNNCWHNGLLLVLALCLVIPAMSGCQSGEDLDASLKTITDGRRFSLFAFEVNAVITQVQKLFSSDNASAEETGIVKEYYSGQLQDEETRKKVEEIIEDQVREAYRDFGILSPFDDILRIDVTFPPVNIYLDRPPRLLVVSPRDEINRLRELMLLPDITEDEMEQIESGVEALGYSACVVGLGGVATYPSYVTDGSGLRFTLDTAAEEWLHQYLAFTPLGFNYVLDILRIRPDDEIAKLNEAVAGIVSKEIGTYIYDTYYREEKAAVMTPEPPPDNTFDFNAAMREIRKNVDELLSNGRIEQAEQYMEEQRQYVEDNGYYIRKLNQAYFAFHGTYAASETSIDPIGDELAELRDNSTSLADFLDTAAGLTSREELQSKLP